MVDDQPDARHNSATVPWQRVVNSKGVISHRFVIRYIRNMQNADSLFRGVNGAERQQTALEAEGVEVSRDAMGERSIDFDVYGWFPKYLPSEQAEREAEDAE